MLFKVFSAAVYGIDANLIEIEVDYSGVVANKDTFHIVGLRDYVVRDSRNRVRAAIKNSGYLIPPTFITINLAPADLKKEGSGFDLPIAVGILGAYGAIKTNDFSRFLLVGELGFDGSVRALPGTLPVAIMAREKGISNLILPAANAAEAAIVEGLNVYPVSSLLDVLDLLNGMDGGVIQREPLRVSNAAPLDEVKSKVKDSRLTYQNFIGQVDNVARLKAFTELFTTTGGTPGPILLIGEEGMGKTSLAIAVANELDVRFQEVDAASLEIQGDITAILTNLSDKQILLLKNIKNFRKVHFDRLKGLLQGDNTINIIIGTRTHKMEIRPFTLIATCCKKSDCPSELLRDFSLVLSLQQYSMDELQALAERIGNTEGISLDAGAAALIAKTCDGRPDQIQSTLKQVTRAINKKRLTEDDVLQAFKAFGINVCSDTPKNLLDNLQNLSGQDFEKIIDSLLTRMGFQTEMTKTTGDGGIDIIARFDKPIFGGLYLFQCKRFSPDNLVGAPTVRDFYGAVTADRAVKGILITTSDFTAQAQEFAQRVGIELIGMTQLQKLFLDYGLITTLDEQETTSA